MGQQLATVGGKDGKEVIRRMMWKVFSNNLMDKYTLMGKSQTKEIHGPIFVRHSDKLSL